MSGARMSNVSASKRKESPAVRGVTGHGPSKRAKTTAAEGDGGDDGADNVPAKPAHALSNLRNTYEQERLGYQRNIDELSARLEASEAKTEEYRVKYKHGLSGTAEKKVAAAEKRVSDTEQKIKQLKQKHKEDIVAIRKELVAAAKDGMGHVQQSTSSPERAFDLAETSLQKLNDLDPELYYELVKGQPVYVTLAARMEAAKVTIDRAPTEGEMAQSPDEATSECGRALKELETDLLNAAEDMRSNSTLSNQKKTLTKKMLAALKEVEPVFMAHAQSPQAKLEDSKPLAPVVDHSTIIRRNQQLQSQVNDLQYKLKDVRSKLEEEVEMRQKAEAQKIETGGKDD